jgi:peptide/nickel transport system substrate-binding protein
MASEHHPQGRRTKEEMKMYESVKLRAIVVVALAIVATGLFACTPETPETIRETVVVEKEVVKTVEVEREVVATVEVAKEVTRVVEKEVVVTPDPVKRGGVLVIAINRELTAMDPHKSSESAIRMITQQIFDTLVRYDGEDMNIVPLLAESWEQPNDTTYIFHLREGVKFHDGSEMTADDVKFSLDRVRDEETASPWQGLLASIDEVVVDDARTVTVKLSYPNAPLLGYLAHFGTAIVPKAYVESGGNLELNPVGTGPFKLESFSALEAVLVRNDDFWIEGLPYLDGMRIIVNADENARAAALRSGTADFLQRAPQPFLGIFAKEGFKVVSDSVGNFRYITFNTEREPLDDWRVRQAIAWALDRDEIQYASVEGLGVPLDGGPIPPGHWAALPEPCFTQDYDKARQLLEEAGYPEGFTLPFMIGPWQEYQRAIEVISEQLAPLGIQVEINLVETAVFLENRSSGNFTAYILGFSGQVDPDQFMDRFRSNGKDNYTNWGNEDFDALADAGVATIDREERKEIYWEAQRLLCEQSPMVFLHVPPFFDVMKQDVMGYDHMMFSEDYHGLRNIWLDR